MNENRAPSPDADPPPGEEPAADDRHPTPDVDAPASSDEEEDGVSVEEESKQSFPASDPPSY